MFKISIFLIVFTLSAFCETTEIKSSPSSINFGQLVSDSVSKPQSITLDGPQGIKILTIGVTNTVFRYAGNQAFPGKGGSCTPTTPTFPCTIFLEMKYLITGEQVSEFIISYLLPNTSTPKILKVPLKGNSNRPPTISTTGNTFQIPYQTSILKQIDATDLDQDKLTFALDEKPTKGEVLLNSSGRFMYTNSTGLKGNDSFKFTVKDGFYTRYGTVVLEILKPTIKLDKTSITFPETANGSGVSKQVLTFTNTSNFKILFKPNISIKGNYFKISNVTSLNPGLSFCNFSNDPKEQSTMMFSMEKNTSCSIEITYEPKLAGVHRAGITLLFSSNKNTELFFGQTIYMIGTSKDYAPLAIELDQSEVFSLGGKLDVFGKVKGAIDKNNLPLIQCLYDTSVIGTATVASTGEFKISCVDSSKELKTTNIKIKLMDYIGPTNEVTVTAFVGGDKTSTLPAQYQTYITDQPANLIAEDQFTPNETADLFVRGRAKENSSFTILARIKLNETDNDSKWQIVSQEITGTVPEGYSAPELIAEAPYIQSQSINGPIIYKKHVLVKHKENTRNYLMDWIVYGKASDTIVPVLIPSVLVNPWTGKKHGWVTQWYRKNSKPEDFNPNYYGVNDEKLKMFADNVTNILNRLSGGKAVVDYEIVKQAEEVSETETDTTTKCRSLSGKYLSSRGITVSNKLSHFQWFLETWSSELLKIAPNCSKPQGNSNGPASPGTYFPNIFSMQNNISGLTSADVPSDMMSYIAIHEIGHGIQLMGSHPTINAPDPSAKKGIIENADRLFKVANYSGPFEDVLSGNYNDYYINPISKITAGWLDGSQVKYTTQSGLYELYTDEEKNVSNRYYPNTGKPLVLVVPINVKGMVDYLFLTIANKLATDRYYDSDTRRRSLQNEGLRLSTIIGPMNSRQGLGKSAIQIVVNSYNADLIRPEEESEATHNHTIPKNATMNIRFEDNNILIQNMGRIEDPIKGDFATVKIKFCALNETCAP